MIDTCLSHPEHAQQNKTSPLAGDAITNLPSSFVNKWIHVAFWKAQTFTTNTGLGKSFEIRLLGTNSVG